MESMSTKYDYTIIGAGIIGLAIAYQLKKSQPQAKVLIVDKERDIAEHASGRNSGVLHAGFYYTADSLKARFTVEGNRTMRKFCEKKNLKINACGKLVVAKNETELKQLFELEQRGKANGSNVKILDEGQAAAIEPNIKTYKKALYSPDTATIDPREVCLALKDDLSNSGACFNFQTKYLGKKGDYIQTTQGDFQASKIINCAGLYADCVAHDFGFGKKYTLIPFKGLYLEYTKNKTDIKTNIYPVPDLRNPFLGVHFTKTVTGTIKIGPTATPAFWRENYKGMTRFDFSELLSVSFYESKLFFLNAFGFRDIAFSEIRKYNKKYFIALASKLVKHIDPQGFGDFTKPGIRAQLLDKEKLSLVRDFVVEGDNRSIHILNAVSPAFTCAFPFAAYVVKNYILPN